MNQSNHPIKKVEEIKKIYETVNKAVAIYEGLYDGMPCYCVKHHNTGMTAPLDYDSEMIGKVIARSKRKGQSLRYKEERGKKYFYFGASASLLPFVFRIYRGLEGSGEEIRATYLDASLQKHGILDMRSQNLTFYSGTREDTDRFSLEIMGGDHSEREIIKISLNNGENVTYCDYSPEMCEILKSTHYGRLFINASGRLYIRAGYKTIRKTMSFARLAVLLRDYYASYDSLKSFCKDLPRLAGGVSDEDADHINPYANICCGANLMLIPGESNKEKRNYLKYLQFGNEDAFAVVNDNREILLEHRSGIGARYYRFREPADFADWVLSHVGRNDFTKNLRIDGEVYVKDVFSGPRDARCADILFDEWYRRKESILNMAERGVFFYPYTVESSRNGAGFMDMLHYRIGANCFSCTITPVVLDKATDSN